MRVLLALGGNALARDDGRVRPEDQVAAAEVAMEAVADLVTHDVEVVLTHGNGPQVGNLLVKNELAAHVVPPVPLDWCGAQTQATLGLVLMNALEHALAGRGTSRRTATVVTRMLVDQDDPGFTKPTKPIGRFLTDAEAAALVERGETWEDRGAKGWRRVGIQEATATGPRTARVSMVARVRPAATAWVLAAWSDGVVITATSTATAD